MISLKIKYDLYLQLSKHEQDQHGFVQYHECDSLLFSGLLGCAPDVDVDLKAAFNQNTGTWHRRALSHPECCPQGAASTISKDMMLGIAWFAYVNKRLDISEQIIKYALSNWFVMGDAVDFKTKISRCVITPGLLATFAEISYKLGGPNRWWLRHLPQYESSSVVDYQAHLSVLHIMLRHRLNGKISKSNENILKMHVKRQPNNPLFHIAVGNFDEAEALLLNESWWPSTRLPTSLDRKEPWLIQRDFGSDWKPVLDQVFRCHSGGDLIFCCTLLFAKKIN